MRGQPRSSLFQTLPAPLWQRLSEFGSCQQYASRQLISSRGDRTQALCIVEQGAVRVSNMGLDGRRVETATLEPGDCFGEFTLFLGSPRFFDFHAEGDTRVRSIAKAQFDLLMADSAPLRNGVLEMLSRRLLTAVEIIEDMRRLPLPTQAAKLIHLQSETDASGQLHFPGSQTDMADLLGVSRVAVGKALAKLQDKGLIRTAYRRIDITDSQKLRQWLQKRTQLLQI